MSAMNVWNAAGSSPHTRGAPTRAHKAWRPRWIIPAYAGSTQRMWTRWTTSMDHPRIRGEHAEADGVRLEAEGSSPHTRGARPAP